MKITDKEIRKIIKEELSSVIEEQRQLQSQIQTVKDFRVALVKAMNAKETDYAKQGGKSAADSTISGLIGTLFPGVGAVKSIYDAFKSMYYKWPDDKRTNTALDALNVDDELSAVLDDRVENQFIQYWLKRLEGVPGGTKLGDLDINSMLSDFIKTNYSGTIAQKGQ